MEIHEELENIYHNFFEELNLDKKTGKTPNNEKRFATKIAIGENYKHSKKKILFVSFDIGKDERFVESGEDTFQDFVERRDSVCSRDLKKNPHMAGVYGTALYFLKDYYGWQESWRILENQNQFFKEALITNSDNLPKDVLSYVSLVNFYNFVTVGRTERTGGNDRYFLNEKYEIQLLIDTIGIITPDIIIVQSKSLKNYFLNQIKSNVNPNIEIYVGVHPSIFGRGINYRRPANYIKNLTEFGRI
jgi:hypothetical protein